MIGVSVSGIFLRLPVLRVTVGPLIRAPQHRQLRVKRILHLKTFDARRDLEKDKAHVRKEQGTDINSKAEGCTGPHLSVFFCPVRPDPIKSGSRLVVPGFIP